MEMPHGDLKGEKRGLDSPDCVTESDPEDVDKVRTAELKAPRPASDMGQKNKILRLAHQLQVMSFDDVAAFCKSEELLKEELLPVSDGWEKVIIRANGLLNRAMTSIHNSPKMCFFSREQLHNFFFCMQNVGSLEVQKEGEKVVFNMWAFQHENTEQYLAVKESEGSWNLVLSSPASETDGHVNAPGTSSVIPVEPGASTSCPDCYKFLVEESQESGGQTVAIIPIQLREANKSLSYSSPNSECPVDVTDGHQDCFQLKRVHSLSCDDDADDGQPPLKRQRIHAKTTDCRPFILMTCKDS